VQIPETSQVLASGYPQPSQVYDQANPPADYIFEYEG
jgi:hypothetical protein